MEGCDCNGWATRCQFNEELYRQTGNGVQCLQCGGNRCVNDTLHSKDHVFDFPYFRDGAHCEKCRQNFYLAAGPDSLDYMDTVSSLSRGHACVPCQCHPEGSEAGQCDAGSGQCPCRPGLTGRRCDACAEKSWNFPLCRPCACLPAGAQGGALAVSSGRRADAFADAWAHVRAVNFSRTVVRDTITSRREFLERGSPPPSFVPPML